MQYMNSNFHDSTAARSNRAFRIIFALILPITALWYSVRNYRSADAQWFFIFGLSFLGFTIGLEGDLEVYDQMFYEMQEVSWGELYENIISLKQGDFYVLVIAKITDIFADSSDLYFAVLISIFAYFYSSIMRCFILLLPKKKSSLLLSVFVAFALYFTIRSFISIRFYTASLVFIYGAIKYLLEKKRGYLLFCLITPAFHLAYSVSLPFVGLFYLLKDKFKTAFVIMVLSFFVGQSTVLELMEDTSKQYSDTVVDNKVNAYASEGGMERLNKRYASADYNFKVKMLNAAKTFSDYFISIGLLLIMYYNKQLLKDQFVKGLATLIFLCWALSNVMMNVSNGNRYAILYLFLGMGLFLVLYVKNYINRPLLTYIKIGTPVVILYNIMAIYAANPLFTINFFISNYIVELFL